MGVQNTLILKSYLTVIKTKEQAREVLQAMAQQNVSFTYPKDNYKVHIEPDQSRGEFVWTDVRSNNPFTNIALSRSVDDSVNELFKDRKYYNAKWRD